MLTAQLCHLGRHAVPRRREVGHDVRLAADAQDVTEPLVLVGVAPTAERKLVRAP